MMKALKMSAAALLTTALLSGHAYAEGSLQHFGESASQLKQSAVNSAHAGGHALVGSAQLVAAVAAVPFKAVAVIGQGSQAVGDTLWQSAQGTSAAKLEVSDETLTAGPAPMVAINTP